MEKIRNKFIQIASTKTNEQLKLYSKKIRSVINKINTTSEEKQASIEKQNEGVHKSIYIRNLKKENYEDGNSQGNKNIICDKKKFDEKVHGTEESINKRTSIILTSIIETTSVQSSVKRLEHFNQHLKAHPGGIYFANSIGAQIVLLKIKHIMKDKATNEIIQETLALLGYAEPPQSTGVRVLTIDGGGMRGLVPLTVLQHLERLSGKRIYQLFDYICGVSTGAIIACCLVPPLSLSVEKIRELYMKMGGQIFRQNAFKGAGKLLLNCAYYDTSVYEKILKDYVGDIVLLETNRYPQCPKMCVVSTVENQRVVPFLFRNYSLSKVSQYPGNCMHSMFEALRATAAAPYIFDEFETKGDIHLDGGIVANNPTGVAIHEVKSLWPKEEISCLVSCGTGLRPSTHQQAKSTSLKRVIGQILESATNTEAVHQIIQDLMPDNIYYRFNPILSTPLRIDETGEEKIGTMEQDANMYCQKNYERFLTVITNLTKPRPMYKKYKDQIKMKIKLSFQSNRYEYMLKTKQKLIRV